MGEGQDRMKRKAADPELGKLKKLLTSYDHPAPIQWMPTGIHAVDLCLGGGIPRARIIEICGNEFAGKTLLGWTIFRAFQKANGVCMFANAEAAGASENMEKLGIDISTIRYEEPETVEQFRKQAQEFIEDVRKIDKKVPICILLDSIANLTGEGEWEDDKELGEVPKDNGQPGVRANALSKFFAQYAVYFKRNDVTLVCNNQLREKIGVMFGKKTGSPGGHSLKHIASVLIELGRGKKIENTDRTEYYGSACYFSVQKNRFATPYRRVELRINANQGYDAWYGLAETLILAKRLILKRPGVFGYGEEEFPASELSGVVEKHPELLAAWV